MELFHPRKYWTLTQKQYRRIIRDRVELINLVQIHLPGPAPVGVIQVIVWCMRKFIIILWKTLICTILTTLSAGEAINLCFPLAVGQALPLKLFHDCQCAQYRGWGEHFAEQKG